MKKDKTDTLKSTVIKNIKLGNTARTSCELADISKTLYYTWLKKDKVFYANTTKAKLNRCRVLESAMFKNALNGNATMQIFLSCNWMPVKYRNVNTIEHTGADGKDLRSIVVQFVGSGIKIKK